jgi:hypothetical protein
VLIDLGTKCEPRSSAKESEGGCILLLGAVETFRETGG